MKEILDRISEFPNRYRLEQVEENVYLIIREQGEVSEEGTPLNRALLMALQGFEAKTTTFDDDGNITETNEQGHTLKTTFNDDGSITETFTGDKTITKTTTFNEDGSITEVIS